MWAMERTVRTALASLWNDSPPSVQQLGLFHEASPALTSWSLLAAAAVVAAAVVRVELLVHLHQSHLAPPCQ